MKRLQVQCSLGQHFVADFFFRVGKLLMPILPLLCVCKKPRISGCNLDERTVRVMFPVRTERPYVLHIFNFERLYLAHFVENLNRF